MLSKVEQKGEIPLLPSYPRNEHLTAMGYLSPLGQFSVFFGDFFFLFFLGTRSTPKQPQNHASGRAPWPFLEAILCHPPSSERNTTTKTTSGEQNFTDPWLVQNVCHGRLSTGSCSGRFVIDGPRPPALESVII